MLSHANISFYIPRYLLVFVLVTMTACAGISRNPVPIKAYGETTVLGQQKFRFWGDQAPPAQLTKFYQQYDDKAAVAKAYPGITNIEHNYLAISGGGANGAYGAGLLAGWSDAGTRPQFVMVTGISTGALTAPFAFLGSAYDQQLKEVYTTIDTASIFRLRNLFSRFKRDSMVDPAPLEETLAKYITDELVAEIAVQHRLGRTLLIGTTNLDAARLVIWNIGNIANSGQPGATKLIRQVLLASASIPGVFPPVYIEVKGPDGELYDEMHVDGGTSSQMFLYPGNIHWSELTDILQVKGQPTAYLIRNSYFEHDYAPVDPKIVPIIKKSMGSLVRAQGIGDAYRIYTLAKRDGLKVYLTSIPSDSVSVEPEEVFDPAYMSALFDYGYERGMAQDAWVTVKELIEDDKD
jgi:hypothetical protein